MVISNRRQYCSIKIEFLLLSSDFFKSHIPHYKFKVHVLIGTNYNEDGRYFNKNRRRKMVSRKHGAILCTVRITYKSTIFPSYPEQNVAHILNEIWPFSDNLQCDNNKCSNGQEAVETETKIVTQKIRGK